ncbi:Cytochrome P450 [Hyphodiscus hymeniophilus]|uniref:Cytochrome P450 n=1 Tax=Hyphodiscus hymeniophilus TaxID=353542 RepID=A0A9P6VPQ0_9HELO|nr:Cytochrome P450 [Hyphodiscus hymeniophilus]
MKLLQAILGLTRLTPDVPHPQQPHLSLDHPASIQFNAWLCAFNTGEKEIITAYHSDLTFPLSVWQAPPGTDALESELQHAEALGGFDVVKIESMDDPSFVVVVATERNDNLQYARFNMSVDVSSPSYPATKFHFNQIVTPLEFILKEDPRRPEYENALKPLTAERRRAVVDGFLTVLEEEFINPSVGVEIKAALEARLANGTYDSIEDNSDFADRLTDDLSGHSRNMFVAFLEPRLELDASDAGPAPQEQLEKFHRMNYGFGNISFDNESVPGRTIATLPINFFLPVVESYGAQYVETRAAVGDIMSSVADADALIIDLRHSLGGVLSTVAFVESYLLEAPRRTLVRVHRNNTVADSYGTLPITGLPAGSKRFGLTKPLFLLTSNNTWRESEQLAYSLQAFNRAQAIIGEGNEATIGMAETVTTAHFVAEETFGKEWWFVGVPTLRPIHSLTGSNWEGVGVKSDHVAGKGHNSAPKQFCEIDSMNTETIQETPLLHEAAAFIGNGYLVITLVEIITPLFRKLPYARDWRWLDLLDRHDNWFRPRLANEKYGDVYMLVGLNGAFLRAANAELIGQIVQRKTDFMKPVEGYKVVDIFGRSIISLEGSEYRRHRRIVAPSFSEKSNKLVFEESLRQAESMMGLWSRQGKNTEKDMRVANTAIDAAILSLHVICAAGFGVPQVWPGESEDKLHGTIVPGFNTAQLSGGHTLPFKESLGFLMKNILWLLALPKWFLERSPFQVHKDVYRAFNETNRYFNELLELKKKQLYLGESDKGTMDLMAPMIKASGEAPSDFDTKIKANASLSKSEIIGNSFIFLFAGHETSANSIHFSIILLAINLASQVRLQADIDKIVGDKPTSDLSYYNDMPRLYNSMVGAVMNEELRLMPVILNVPKVTTGDQVVTVDGREFPVANGTYIQLNIVGTHRNPLYWPHSPSSKTGKSHDLDEFVPERWLTSNTQDEKTQPVEKEDDASVGEASYDSGSLFQPVKHSFIAFSEGARGCPGRRFAQVEITAVLTAIFQKYTVELEVSQWASDEEVARMSLSEKKALYQKAADRADTVLKRCEQRTITLQMLPDDTVPVRFVKRGEERFAGLMG